jgi:opacity protein-like surface antigen
MKKFLAILALTALATSPGLAASHSRHRVGLAATENAFAYAPPASGTVMADGRYLGSDPDRNIRLDLLRQGDQRNIGGGGGN